MDKFILDGQYKKLLDSHGINVGEILCKAGMPEDIFSRKAPVMKIKDYFRLMEVLGNSITNPDLAIQIAAAENIEGFSAPIFAAYCSKNGLTCVERLGRYKKLIGPIEFIIQKNESESNIEIKIEDPSVEIPQFLIKTEMVFLVNLLRKATKEKVNPVCVSTKKPINDVSFTQFMTVQIEHGDKNQITFLNSDLEIPFISYNDTMWNFFEPELKRRLSELEIDDSFSARVRSALIELLPGGISSIEEVSSKLGISKRSLQRKLGEESTTFQKQLNSTRELLAKHYICNTDRTSSDIAYLLGYQELNSFLRAFSLWTGESISDFKKSRQANKE